MKQAFWNILIFSATAIIIFLVINFVVLLWYKIDPTGFTGVFWFYTILTGGLALLLYFIATIIGIIGGIISKEYKGWKEKGSIVLIFILSLLFFGVFKLGPEIYISKKLYDKYRYINISDRYFKKGKYDEALSNARKLYNLNAQDSLHSSSIWFMKYRFLRKDKGIQLYANRKFQSTINYAFCLESLGSKLQHVEKLYLECEDLQREFFPDHLEYYLVPLILRAQLYLKQGKVVESEKLYNQFYSYLNELNEDDLILAISYMQVYANHEDRHGDNRRANEIRELALNKYHEGFTTRGTSFHIGLVLPVINYNINIGNLEEADRLIKLIKHGAKKRKKKLVYLDYLNTFAYYQETIGEINKSEKLYKKALRGSGNKSDIVSAEQLTTIAQFYFRNKSYKQAQKYFGESANIYSKLNGRYPIPISQSIGMILSNYSIGAKEFAINQIQELDSILRDRINKNFILLTFSEREKYISKLEAQFNYINSLYLTDDDSTNFTRVYNNVLALKSISFQSEKYLERELIASGKIRTYENLVKLKSARKDVDDKYLMHTYSKSGLISEIDSINRLERLLLEDIHNSKTFSPFNINAVNFDSIRRVLKNNEVAIELINYPFSPIEPSENVYYAVILRNFYSYPDIIPLFRESEISKLLSGNCSKKRIDSLYISGQGALYKKIVEPLKPLIDSNDIVYISLCGLLHKIAIPSLFVNEPFTINVLSSTRKIAERSSTESKKFNKSLLYGGIHYLNEKSDSSYSNIAEPFRTLENVICRSGFSPLPGTDLEVEQIAEILRGNNVESLKLKGTDATELSFRNAQRKNFDIIHIATHGFYYSKESSGFIKNKLFGLKTNYTPIENPMQRSGLVFAGLKYNLDSTNNNGILTSNEIAQLNYCNTDLVVLSACETGLGDVLGSEGVYGLQRAFKLAGVEKILLSLWKVPDAETSELMISFYSFLVKGENANESLKKAQKEMQLKYEDPYFWAGFYILN